MNALKQEYFIKNRQMVLHKAMKQTGKIHDFFLRRALKKWYINALKEGTKAKFFGKLLINNDFRMNHLIEKMMRKALY